MKRQISFHLEGFKHSKYPKIEVVRKEISKEYVCEKETILALATDLEWNFSGIKSIDINNIEEIINVLLKYINEA